MKIKKSKISIQKILLLFLIWRLYILLASIISFKYVPFDPQFPYVFDFLKNSKMPQWIWSFGNFDGVHYLKIEHSGYSAEFSQAFFPFYPMIISALHEILFFLDPLVIALLVSNVVFFLSLVIFSRLLALDYNERVSYWALLFLLFFQHHIISEVYIMRVYFSYWL